MRFEPEPLTAPVHFPALEARTLVLLPVDASTAAAGQWAAVLLVPDAFGGSARLERVPVGAGMHPLRHGARLDLGPQELWISLSCLGEEVPYDPAAHGPERHCFRVKAMLKPGEPVVSCPGVPLAPCAVFYKAAAWHGLRQCTSCGHEPAAAVWSPPLHNEGRSLDELFARALARRA